MKAKRIARRALMISGPLVAVGLTVVAIVGLSATAPQPEKAEQKVRPMSVFTAEVRSEPVRLTVTTQGEVRPRTEIDLVPQVSGRIVDASPGFVDGGTFAAGDLLIKIEDEDYRLAVTRAEARVAQARQALVREQAEADLAARDWQELGEGEASALTLREPQLAEARASLAAAQAELRDARLDLQRTEIRAPFDGRVRTKAADIGQYVGQGTRVGRIFATDRAEIRLPLTDSDLARLDLPIAFVASADNEGPAVDFSAIVAGKPRQWRGRIVRTESAIDSQTRVLYAVAQVADPYGAGASQPGGVPLAVGLFVDAEVAGRRIDGAMVVPRAALRPDDRIFVATADDTLSIRQVTVASATPERVIVTDGVAAGERVITSPLSSPAAGMNLAIIGEAESAATAFTSGAADDSARENRS
jgi:RND family efflux transporter MFP subunit